MGCQGLRRLCSIVATGRLAGRNALDAIRDALPARARANRSVIIWIGVSNYRLRKTSMLDIFYMLNNIKL